MSARARDVVPLACGTYLLALGGIFLLDSTGAVAIGGAGLVAAAVGLALILLGLLSLLAAWRVRRFTRRLRRTIGHLRSAQEWAVEDAVMSTVVGDISLDLRNGRLPEGETDLTLLCWLGAIHVRVPADAGVDVTAQSMIGSVDVLGRYEEGLLRDIHVRSEGYAERERRLRLRLSTFLGELVVVQK